jgi:hypothetical protein
MATASLPTLEAAIIAIFSTPSVTAGDMTSKAHQLAVAIDNHTSSVILATTGVVSTGIPVTTSGSATNQTGATTGLGVVPAGGLTPH